MRKVTDSVEPEEPSAPPSTPPDEAATPLAWRSHGRRLPKEPTQEELDALPVKERLELIGRRRASIHQFLNSIGIVLTVVFTAVTVVTTQQELRVGQQGQITDRYTKAVDQLGSTKLDIRLGGIYALERLASDSPRDDRTVYDVLCAFVREHDPKPPDKPPPLADIHTALIYKPPATDIQVALTVIGRRKPLTDGFNPDLTSIRTSQADLTQAKLANAKLFNADLTGADLTGTDLHSADLHDAVLFSANLLRANMAGADLERTDLFEVDLRGANLEGANLTRADLTNAVLTGANLEGANLTSVHLEGANLTNVNLEGANLRVVQGMTPDEIRKQARTDSHTRF